MLPAAMSALMLYHLAHETEIDIRLPLLLQGELPPHEDVLPMHSDRSTAELHDARRDAGIDRVVQDVLHDCDRLRIGDAQAVHEARLLPRIAHPLGNRLSSAVDQHRVDPHRLEQHDVPQQPIDDRIILHRAPAILDDEELAAKFLDVRKRLDEGFSTCCDGDGHGNATARFCASEISRLLTRPCRHPCSASRIRR
jgi:hypothetical protein